MILVHCLPDVEIRADFQIGVVDNVIESVIILSKTINYIIHEVYRYAGGNQEPGKYVVFIKIDTLLINM